MKSVKTKVTRVKLIHLSIFLKLKSSFWFASLNILWELYISSGSLKSEAPVELGLSCQLHDKKINL